MEIENLRFYELKSTVLKNKSGIYKFSAGEHANCSEIKIIPKLRCMVKEDFPGKRK